MELTSDVALNSSIKVKHIDRPVMKAISAPWLIINSAMMTLSTPETPARVLSHKYRRVLMLTHLCLTVQFSASHMSAHHLEIS